ncbi:aspartic proteinase CDR1-like [Tripterygium wilfordii]|uniref:aspartic proteinase CDR1-like n=1 Tax=Tripterygium wilfordii TaxID=458696 RepID=UPI0018F82B0E|nr:aspartic proteinase CDR1-like [Tripterygium wilfordii]
MDTGSNFLWVQCQTCTRCFNQTSKIFDPSKSSTYANLSYGTKTAGIIGTEKLTFETSDEGETTIDNVIFGCGHDNDVKNGQPSGVLGLGPDSISLVSKLGSKFSYCVGSVRDPKYSFNQLNLGEGVIIEGGSTPLELFHTLYYVTLEGISLAENMLKIDPQVFRRTPSGTGGVVIDSGSTITYLATDAYDSLSDQVKSLLDGKMERIRDKDDPKRRRHYATRETSKGISRDVFCMAVQESDLNGLSVIGIMAQQSYNVGFDLIGKTISFQRIDCELLES